MPVVMADSLAYDGEFRVRGYFRPSEEEVIITRMLEKIIRRSDAVDKESLCIVAGQRVRFTSFF